MAQWFLSTKAGDLVVAEKKRMEDGEVSRSVTGTAFTQDGAGPRPRGLDLTSQGPDVRLPTVRRCVHLLLQEGAHVSFVDRQVNLH